MSKASNQQPGFEKALERLETLVSEMEEGNLSLDKMMAHFEEGMSLVKLCSARLNEVERRIEILLKKGNELVEEPFQTPETDAGSSEPADKISPNDEEE